MPSLHHRNDSIQSVFQMSILNRPFSDRTAPNNLYTIPRRRKGHVYMSCPEFSPLFGTSHNQNVSTERWGEASLLSTYSHAHKSRDNTHISTYKQFFFLIYTDTHRRQKHSSKFRSWWQRKKSKMSSTWMHRVCKTYAAWIPDALLCSHVLHINPGFLGFEKEIAPSQSEYYHGDKYSASMLGL